MKKTFVLLFLIPFYLIAYSQENKGKVGDRNSLATTSNNGNPQTDDTPIYELDLSKPILTENYQVESGEKFKIKIINMVPGARYSINQKTEPKIEPPIAHNGEEAAKTDDPCMTLSKQLTAAQSESAFGLLMAEASIACPKVYNIFLVPSSKDYKAIQLHNEVYTITIVNLVSKTTWTYTFETKSKGKVLTTYGFTYIPYLFSKSHTYYAKQQPSQGGGTAATYNITPYSWGSESHSEFAPTVMFHFLDYADEKWSASWTAGLGANFSTASGNNISPLVLFGRSIIYHQIYGLSIGIAGHTVNNLKGNYRIDTPITTNLETSDLIQKQIAINPFISVTIRFASDPNKKTVTDNKLVTEK